MASTPSSVSMDFDEERQFFKSDKGNGAQWSSTSSLRSVDAKSRRVLTWSGIYVVFLHIALLGFGILLFLQNMTSPEVVSLAGRSWSPVNEFIRYEVRADNSSLYNTESKYSGPPSDESDDNWWELLEPALFNASTEEVLRAGESLEDAAEVTMGGYLAGIGVYHELHCLHTIRTYIHEEYYFPNMTDEKRYTTRHHIDHCVELLRSLVMCHGTTDFEVFFWGENSPELPEARSSAKRVCVDWDSLHNWSKSRMVPGDEPPVLPRPAHTKSDEHHHEHEHEHGLDHMHDEKQEDEHGHGHEHEHAH